MRPAGIDLLHKLVQQEKYELRRMGSLDFKASIEGEEVYRGSHELCALHLIMHRMAELLPTTADIEDWKNSGIHGSPNYAYGKLGTNEITIEPRVLEKYPVLQNYF